MVRFKEIVVIPGYRGSSVVLNDYEYAHGTLRFDTNDSSWRTWTAGKSYTVRVPSSNIISLVEENA